MIVDAHIHCTQPPSADRPHDAAGFAVEFLSVDELLAKARPLGIDKIVQITPSVLGYDNRYSFEVAAQRPDEVAGVVARFDPLAPGCRERLEELQRQPKMAAIRLTLTTPESQAWLAGGTIDPFFSEAERAGVAIQLFAPFRVAEMHATVKRFPGIRWLIDHMGLRYQAGMDNRDTFRQWAWLIALAGEENVWIKCSYFPEAAKDIERYPFPSAQQYFRELYASADASRLIWGSDFPPVLRACNYGQALDFVRLECDFLSAGDREAILGGNFMQYFAPRAAAV